MNGNRETSGTDPRIDEAAFRGAASRAAAAPPTVIVAGAGVSGTACAASLAGFGTRVILVNSALDVVGLPAYGPAVETPDRTWTGLAEVFHRLPRDVATAWLAGAQASLGERARVVVDRRRVSMRLKWLLENLPGVEFRQGLVVSVERERDVQVLVTTAFGEEFRGEACVLAPGLALRGRVQIGDQRLAGGRYGEVPADRLFECLQRAGVPFRPTVVDVGACVRGADPRRTDDDWVRRNGAASLTPLARSRLAGLFDGMLSFVDDPRLVAAGHAEVRRAMRGWEDRLPLQVEHESPSVEAPWGDSESGVGPMGHAGRGGRTELLPDGVATGEWYVASGALRAGLDASEWTVTRPPHRIEAQVVASGPAGDEGSTGVARVSTMPGVWVCGRAAGARSYVESLVSGAVAAREVACALGMGADSGSAAAPLSTPAAGPPSTPRSSGWADS